MKLEKSQIAGIIIAFILIGAVIVWALSNKKKLLDNYKITNAIVNDCYSGGIGHVGITILYRFNLEGKEITGTATFNNDILSLPNAKQYVLGKTFPVAYNPQHPSNNSLIIRKKDFNQFNINMPDSLKWLLKYVH